MTSENAAVAAATDKAGTRVALWCAAWMGVVGTVLQLVALYEGPVAGDYRRGFWLEVIGSLLGSWAWRIYKAAKWS